VAYDNTRYWIDIHRSLPGSLRAVGHPWLSEALNELKYQSEAESLGMALELAATPLAGKASLKVLDIGTGTGYWAEAIVAWLACQKVTAELTVLDISAEALANVKKRHPEFETIHADLKAVDPSSQRGGFDLVTSFYCLHHIPRAADFLNGLRFAGRSVASDGLFLLMDPILARPYSPFHAMAFRSENTNGMPRTLSLIDDLLNAEGLERVVMVPAVSFILNGAIEAGSKLVSELAGRTWYQLQRVYRRDGLTRRLSAAIIALDRKLKKATKGLSSSLIIYHRIR